MVINGWAMNKEKKKDRQTTPLVNTAYFYYPDTIPEHTVNL